MSYEDIVRIVERLEKEENDLTKLNKLFKGRYNTRLEYNQVQLKKMYKKLESVK